VPLGHVEFVLHLIHLPESIPAVVVPVVRTNGASIRIAGFVEFFIGYVLVPL
jgi:hypothetical protein